MKIKDSRSALESRSQGALIAAVKRKALIEQ